MTMSQNVSSMSSPVVKDHGDDDDDDDDPVPACNLITRVFLQKDQGFTTKHDVDVLRTNIDLCTCKYVYIYMYRHIYIYILLYTYILFIYLYNICM